MMAMADQRFRLRHALFAGACGLLLCFSGTLSAYAQEAEDEDTFEQKIIKKFLGGLGVDVGQRAGIDYRERSPLVVPPTRDLPPPEAAAASRNPAWPKEHVKKRAAAAPRTNIRANADDPGTSSALTPDELRRGAKPGAGRITDPSQSGSVEEPNIGRPSRPQDLGSTNLLTWGNLMRSTSTETAPFTGEPTRSTLTQPPPGYQTPSPSAPYGTATDTPSGWKIPTILSRPEGSADSQ
jgi:hypothetical protein